MNVRENNILVSLFLMDFSLDGNPSDLTLVVKDASSNDHGDHL